MRTAPATCGRPAQNAHETGVSALLNPPYSFQNPYVLAAELPPNLYRVVLNGPERMRDLRNEPHTQMSSAAAIAAHRDQGQLTLGESALLLGALLTLMLSLAAFVTL